MIQSAINKAIGSIVALNALKGSKIQNKPKTEQPTNNSVSNEISALREVLVKHFDEQKAAAANQNLQEQAKTATNIQEQKNQIWNSIVEQARKNQGNKPIPKKSETMKKGENK